MSPKGDKLETQRRAFKFLTEHLNSQQSFTKEEFQKAAGWTDESMRTYWPKHYKTFVENLGAGSYRISESFRPFANWRKFRDIVSQTRRVVTNYTPSTYDHVLIFEFFMPLRNEEHLKATLDSLFLKDAIDARLRAIGLQKLRDKIPLLPSETEPQYFERLIKFIGDHFIGYSVYQVEGRFRAGKLSTHDEVVALEKQGLRYLIDEHTAVTRFIFPCNTNPEADIIRALFDVLFVKSIIQLVNGEDEIWMVEAGMRNRVHVWSAQGDDSSLFDEEDE